MFCAFNAFRRLFAALAFNCAPSSVAHRRSRRRYAAQRCCVQRIQSVDQRPRRWLTRRQVAALIIRFLPHRKHFSRLYANKRRAARRCRQQRESSKRINARRWLVYIRGRDTRQLRNANRRPSRFMLAIASAARQSDVKRRLRSRIQAIRFPRSRRINEAGDFGLFFVCARLHANATLSRHGKQAGRERRALRSAARAPISAFHRAACINF